jgi:hypothetical protein
VTVSVLVEETGVLGENHRPAASYWQTLSDNVANCAHHHDNETSSKIYFQWQCWAHKIKFLLWLRNCLDLSFLCYASVFVFVFVLCLVPNICMCLWILYSLVPIRFSLTFICIIVLCSRITQKAVLIGIRKLSNFLRIHLE